MSCCNPLTDWMNPPAVDPANIERWLPLKLFPWPYEVSDKGRVRSLNYNRTGVTKILKTSINRGGYPYIVLRTTKSVARTVHALVTHVWIGLRPKELAVNHINGIKTDNRLENLEYVTYSRNSKHSFEVGLQCNKGIQHSQARLDDDKVRLIRKMIKSGIPRKDIAHEFGVTTGMIANIHLKRNWNHVKDEEVE